MIEVVYVEGAVVDVFVENFVESVVMTDAGFELMPVLFGEFSQGASCPVTFEGRCKNCIGFRFF